VDFRALQPSELTPKRTLPSPRGKRKEKRREASHSWWLKQPLSPQSIRGRGYKADNLYSQLGQQRGGTPRSVQKQRRWVEQMEQGRDSALVLSQ